MKNITQTNHLLLAISSLIVLSIYHFIFYKYFPNSLGRVGNDYSYFLPNLLNGVYWFRENGLFSVPWFTPAFCGGLPFLPNPQNIYYSLPQVLSFIINPLTSVYFSMLIFAGLGFVGTFLLLRKVFLTGQASAFLGSTLFLFNSFYSCRMVIGHLTYQVFALLPLLSWLLLRKSESKSQEAFTVVLAGVVLAYMFYAGAANFIVPVILGVVCIWSLLGIVSYTSYRFWKRLCLSGMISLLLSAAKLNPAIMFLGEFRRDYYSLPGFDGIWNTMATIFDMLFFPVSSDISYKVVNYPYLLGPPEFEYGVTLVPLVLMLIFPIHWIKNIRDPGKVVRASLQRFVYYVIFLAIIAIPVVLNSFYPGWSLFIKELPYIENSTNLFRWVTIYIPIVVILASLAVELIKHPHLRLALVMSCLFFIILYNLITDRSTYVPQTYSPTNIIAAWSAATPDITFNDNLPGTTKAVIYSGRNDLMVTGGSQIYCYEPMFGYLSEYFPRQTLDLGSVAEVLDGHFNFKNPACYLFPEQNQCKPGDHFSESERDKLDLLTSYRPYPFQMPLSQKFFNLVSILTLIISVIILSMLVVLETTHSWKKHSK